MARPGTVLLRDVGLVSGERADVRVAGRLVMAVGRLSREPSDETCVDADGGALLPGLHDHHVHVLATVAARRSVRCGPPEVTDTATLARRLARAERPDGWVRGVGYDEAVAGDLDATVLDRLAPRVPVRVQHRSGALWVVNSIGMQRLGLADRPVEGIERDAAGRPTGRLWRLDGWLRERLRETAADGESTHPQAPDVEALSAELAGRGLTGLTDATPDLDAGAVRAIVSGGLRQRLVSLGVPHGVPGVGLGPAKVVVPDHRPIDPDELAARVRVIRPRAVAVHCVTRAALVVTLAALEQVGTVPGDRVEHAAVADPELARWLARLAVAVVTQPSLLARWGKEYFERVDVEDRMHVWPVRTLLDAGVELACSSDAPFGDPDPWVTVAAAVHRRTETGRVVGATERVDAWSALRGFLTHPAAPGGPIRTVRPGAAADVCLLDRPLCAALAAPHEVAVRMTIVGGDIVHAARA